MVSWQRVTGHLHMLVLIRWQGRDPAVSLSQMLAIRGDEATNKAIADWHYGMAQGYRFCAASGIES
jgi:hypothetical protein